MGQADRIFFHCFINKTFRAHTQVQQSHPCVTPQSPTRCLLPLATTRCSCTFASDTTGWRKEWRNRGAMIWGKALVNGKAFISLGGQNISVHPRGSRAVTALVVGSEQTRPQLWSWRCCQYLKGPVQYSWMSGFPPDPVCASLCTWAAQGSAEAEGLHWFRQGATFGQSHPQQFRHGWLKMKALQFQGKKQRMQKL